MGGMSDLADELRRQLKDDGRECFVWYCPEPDPKFPVTWKCGAGHRDTLWYCGEHGGQAATIALQAAREEAGLMCQQCAPMTLMKPVAETAIL
jgi:hypothetical protein